MNLLEWQGSLAGLGILEKVAFPHPLRGIRDFRKKIYSITRMLAQSYSNLWPQSRQTT
jgi:hypothetical protein